MICGHVFNGAMAVLSIYIVLLLCCSVINGGPLGSPHDNLNEGHVCNHKYPTVDDIPHHVHLEHKHHVMKRSLDHNMRIKVFYDSSVNRLPRVKRNVVKNQVVPEGVGYWEDVLKVRRNEATILLNRKCDGNQFFLLDDEGNDARSKNASCRSLQECKNAGHAIQYCKERCIETKCGEFVIPNDHLQPCHTCDSKGWDCKKESEGGRGIDGYDFVLYVTAINTKQCGDTIANDAATVAYAAHCQQEKAFDRPIAGHTNICPGAIVDGQKEISMLISTVKHELLHALGFSLSLFAFYHDKDGNPLTAREDDGKPPINRELQVRQWSENIIKQVERPWNVRSGTISREFNIVVTPRVVEEVRNHFACDDLDGAELEDQGGEGTAITHWEKRIFQNEAMTGTVHTNSPTYSRVTFALMEDTGWYLPDYSKAQNITWGKNKGCDFAKKSCKELMDNDESLRKAVSLEIYDTLKSPFCNTLQNNGAKTICNHDRTSVGSCNLVKYQKALPRKYQNFKYVEDVRRSDISKVGSSVALADYCPYVQEFSWKSEDGTSRGTACANPKNQPKNTGDNLNYALETYSDYSKCFDQGMVWNQESCSIIKNWHRYGAGCYEYKCKDGKVSIIVGKGSRHEEVVCDKAGQNVSIALQEGDFLHMGAIICPGCIEICGEANCSSNFAPANQDRRLNKSVGDSRSSNVAVDADIPDSKVGVQDELDCGDGGFFDYLY